MEHVTESGLLRREKIRARESLTAVERRKKSAEATARILASPEFKAAKTMLLYRAIRGELSLEGLWGQGKRLAFPLCTVAGVMEALCPETTDGWQTGSFGILEPVREKSLLIAPGEIDLVLCPCTVFDENCGRMGMGGGYYDRFLPHCTNATIAAVAFEIQKTEALSLNAWDVPMDMVFTEKAIYRRKQSSTYD